MRLKNELQSIIALNGKQLEPKKICTSWKRCDPQFFGQLQTIATTLTSGNTLARDIIASNANIASTGPPLFSGLFYAGSSSLKYVLFCGNCNIQLSIGQLRVVMPVQVQLALVSPGLLLSAFLRIVNLAQMFVAPAYTCCWQIQQLNKPLDVVWRPVKMVPLALGRSLLEPRILTF